MNVTPHNSAQLLFAGRTSSRPEEAADQPETLQATTSIAQKKIKSSEVPLSADPKRGLHCFWQYPKKQLTRLLVDGILLREEKGAEAYERREPGCLGTLINGWIYVTEKLSQLEGTPQVDIAFIKEIHRNIAEHDSRFNPGIFFSEMSPGEPSTIYVPLAHQKLESVKFYDLDGLTEAETRHSRQMETLWSQKKSRGLPYVFCFASSAQVGSGAPVFIPLPEGKARALLENREQPEALLKVLQDIFYHLKYDQRDVDISRRLERLYGGGSGDGDKEKYWLNQWAEHIRQRGGQTVLSMSVSEGVELLMAACLKSLNKALSEVNSREQLFKVICSHISEMIALHPFDSANGRTFCLLMQYLLMAYGFPPATFDSPGIFAYGSHDRQLQELERSVEASRIVLECGGQKSFYLHGYQAKGSEKSVFKSTAKIFHQQRQRQQSALKAAESRPSAPLANRRSTLLLSSLCH